MWPNIKKNPQDDTKTKSERETETERAGECY